MMERRRMDAALLGLFLVHLATALEVPLDRKATQRTPQNDPQLRGCKRTNAPSQ